MINFERTFDNTSVGYDKSRPAYPKDIYQDIFKYKCIDKQSNVLEIGLAFVWVENDSVRIKERVFFLPSMEGHQIFSKDRLG